MKCGHQHAKINVQVAIECEFTYVYGSEYLYGLFHCIYESILISLISLYIIQTTYSEGYSFFDN